MTKHRPVIFWLLLAATISVDAIALSWMASEPFPAPYYLTVVCHALILGQLNIVCIWSSLTLKKTAWTRSAPIAAAILATLIMASTNEPVWFLSAFTNHLSNFGLHAALLVAALWPFERTTFWRRRCGIARDWRYSLAHLLIAMTVVAVLAAAMRNSPYFGDDRWINIAFVGSSVALAVASVFLWSLTWPWLRRLAGVLGVALLLALAFALSADFMMNNKLSPDPLKVFAVHYLLQALVLSIWLACGPVLPDQVGPVAADS